VIILNQGQLIAQGTVEELLSTRMGLNYKLVLKGESTRAHQHLLKIPWVQEVDFGYQNGKSVMHVAVKDEDLAERYLLREVLSDENMRVLEFSRNKQNLEEVFLRLVEGEA